MKQRTIQALPSRIRLRDENNQNNIIRRDLLVVSRNIAKLGQLGRFHANQLKAETPKLEAYHPGAEALSCPTSEAAGTRHSSVYIGKPHRDDDNDDDDSLSQDGFYKAAAATRMTGMRSRNDTDYCCPCSSNLQRRLGWRQAMESLFYYCNDNREDYLSTFVNIFKIC